MPWDGVKDLFNGEIPSGFVNKRLSHKSLILFLSVSIANFYLWAQFH